MARINTAGRKPALPPQGGRAPQSFEPSNTLRTHEGAPASLISAEQQLRRSVCSCLLWEDEFYEDGTSVARRIADLVAQCTTKVVADLAVDARSNFNLRHVPLLLLAALAAPGRGGTRLIGDAIADAIQRPDELSEFVAVYAKVWGVAPSAVKKRLSAQAKKGLARAFAKFDRYQLAKYFSRSGEKDAVVRGRDVMFMVHPKPADDAQAALWRRVARKEPIVAGGADTWEVALSAGADKRETFERLLREEKLGYLALLRNLRNMREAGVDEDLVNAAIIARRGARRVLPFRYVAAVRACPTYAYALGQALAASLAEVPPLPGRTVVLADVSGSMDGRLSGRSELDRMDAAATLAAMVPGDVRIFTFSNEVIEVHAERGFAMIEAIKRSQPHQGTYLGQAIESLIGSPHYSRLRAGRREASAVPMDRLVVLTDEQAHDHVPPPAVERAYLINVASARNGIGYGAPWVHLDGFSEQTLRWIREYENL